MSTSCSHYFRETLRGAERLGISVDHLLKHIGLDPNDINDPAWRGSSEKLAELVQMVWLLLDDEFMGFLRQRCKPGVFAMMCNVIIHEHTVGAALRKGVFFYSLFTDEIRMVLSKRNERHSFEVAFRHPELDPNHYFLEFWLSIWYRAMCWMAGRTVVMKAVDFSYPRPVGRAEELRYIFPTRHRFAQEKTMFVFDEDLDAIPNVRSRAELKTMLERAPLVFMTVPTNVNSMARRIRNDILGAKGEHVFFPQLEFVADRYGMSVQTLRRRLNNEGTSFRTVIEGIRRDLALRKLLKTNATVSAIAASLGYSETRAFTRAFNQWTGMSPRTYRKTILGKLMEPTREGTAG